MGTNWTSADSCTECECTRENGAKSCVVHDCPMPVCEDGFEIIFDIEDAKVCWQQLIDQGVKPCGLGARDTLRLEAGMNLYGNDMDETISPLVSNLAWTIPFEPHERIFIGRLALEAEKARGITQQLVGLVLEDKGVLRDGLSVTLENGGTGVITSGSFSPTMGKGIAMARITLPISSANFLI